MALITERFAHFPTVEAYNQALQEGLIDSTKIVVIDEDNSIWTHGERYNKPRWGEIGDKYNGHDYVDMGEAGIWASCNVGATKPEEYGLYFPWGGTSGKTYTGFYLEENPFYVQGSPSLASKTLWTKYTITPENSESGVPDNKTVLELEDDAAHINMGGIWKMPTVEDFKKLINLCKIDNHTINGVKGILFTLKTDSSKQLFFPTTNPEYSYGYGYYWSSSLYQGSYSSSAYDLWLSYGSWEARSDYYSRGSLYSVRGFIPPKS